MKQVQHHQQPLLTGLGWSVLDTNSQTSPASKNPKAAEVLITCSYQAHPLVYVASYFYTMYSTKRSCGNYDVLHISAFLVELQHPLWRLLWRNNWLAHPCCAEERTSNAREEKPDVCSKSTCGLSHQGDGVSEGAQGQLSMAGQG